MNNLFLQKNAINKEDQKVLHIFNFKQRNVKT